MSGPQGRYQVSMAPAGLSAGYQAGVRSGGRGRALPIVVASGLAMGVFAGLFVVRGTGEEGAAAPPPPAAAPAPTGSAPTSPQPVSPAGTAPTAAETSVSPDPGSPGAPANPGTVVPAARKVAVLSFEVKQRRVHILVNGEEIEGTTAEIPLENGTATVDVLVRGRGYKTYRKTLTVTEDQAIEISLRRDREEPSGPGGQLDIR